MDGIKSYHLENTYRGFSAHLFGQEGAQSSFGIAFELDKTPLQTVLSPLERYCVGAVRDGVSEEGHSYKWNGIKLNVSPIPQQSGSVIVIRCDTGDNLESIMQYVKDSYIKMRELIKSLGYDTTEFDGYLNSFTIEELRRHEQEEQEAISIEDIEEALGSGQVVLLGAGEGINLGAKPPAELPQVRPDQIVYRCKEHRSAYLYNREGLVGDKPSLYAQLVQEDTRNGSRRYSKGLPTDILELLFEEANDYSNRGDAFFAEKDYKRSLLDNNRALRILSFILDQMPAKDLRVDMKIRVLSTTALVEYNAAQCGADIAKQQGDYRKALRYLSRAQTQLELLVERMTKPQDEQHDGEPQFSAEDGVQTMVLQHTVISSSMPIPPMMRKMMGLPPSTQGKNYIEKLSREIAVEKQDLEMYIGASPQKPSDLTLVELTLEQQLKYLTDKQRFEEAQIVARIIKRRNLEDPLEFDSKWRTVSRITHRPK